MKNIIFSIVIILRTGSNSYCQEHIPSYQTRDFRLTIMLPHFNTLSFKPDKKIMDVEYGFNGYGIGLEYSYLPDKFISAGYSLVMTYEWPLPVPIDAEYNKILLSSYFNITDNIVLGRITIGYGINYSFNTWKEWIRPLDTVNRRFKESKSFTNNNLGLTFNSYFRVGRTLHFGIIYQPSLFSLTNKPSFLYEHSISASVIWRFKLFNTNMKTGTMIRRI